MFLKVEKAKDDFYFIDLAGKEELLIGKQQTIDLPIDGLILFLKRTVLGILKIKATLP